MDMPEKKYTVTAALPYANGPVHIGHLAGVYVPADIYVRYLRSKGEDVVFVCGSDEHGVPITIRAKKEGVSPQEVVDKYHRIIKQSFEDFGVSFDIYSRTSSQIHHQTVSEFFTKLYQQGEFEVKELEQYYDEKNKQFLADRYLIGICPNCSFDQAYGDQCESCGSSLNSYDLKDPRSALSGEKPIKKLTKHWYLPLDKYESWLKEWIVDNHQNDWKPNVYGQCKSWIDQGLHPRAITRDLEWGVPVPLQDAKGKVLYVWFDAPIGYISATKEWAKKTGKDWEVYWKGKNTKLIHFIGKDNIVFHCIIFPSMLHAEGSYVLPENVPANEFLNLEGNKISTSKNWAIWLHEYLRELPGKEDVLRYVLCANAPETKDNDFTWKDFQARNNNELVAILGNFIHRALVLTSKYCHSKVPTRGELFDIDQQAIDKIGIYPDKIAQSIEKYRFREAMSYLIDLARVGNKYLADTEPWKLIKESPDRVPTILNISLQLAANLSVLGKPFLPFSMDKLQKMLNIQENSWQVAGTVDLLENEHQMGEPSLLFEKIEDEMIATQVKKLEDAKKQNQMDDPLITPCKQEIVFEDFMKMDMRVGTVIAVEKLKKSKKLLKLTINTGLDKRIVLSGIAEYYQPEELIDQQVCVLINLKPRKMMGIESQGMVLMAEDRDGSLRLLRPNEMVASGSEIS